MNGVVVPHCLSTLAQDRGGVFMSVGSLILDRSPASGPGLGTLEPKAHSHLRACAAKAISGGEWTKGKHPLTFPWRGAPRPAAHVISPESSRPRPSAACEARGFSHPRQSLSSSRPAWYVKHGESCSRAGLRRPWAAQVRASPSSPRFLPSAAPRGLGTFRPKGWRGRGLRAWPRLPVLPVGPDWGPERF